MTRHVTDPETARRQLRDHEHELPGARGEL